MRDTVHPLFGRLRGFGRWQMLTIVLAVILAISGTASVFAVHDFNLVEVDGNVVDDSAAPNSTTGTDWGPMFGPNTLTTGKLINTPTGTVDSVFLQDFVLNASGPDSSYHEPSNKDTQAILASGGSNVWGCGSVPNPTDKDDILNAMALAVNKTVSSANHRIIYVAGDRFDNSGTAYIGAWFFQARVGCDAATGKFVNLDNPSLPGKTTGDVLMLVNFSAGGAPANISIFAFSWTAGASASDPGTFSPIAESGACLPHAGNPPKVPASPGASPSDDLCAEVNFGDIAASAGFAGNGTFTSTWPLQDKDTPAGTTNGEVKLAEFFEAGIDLTAALSGSTVPCFSSFMLETRSSDSLTATLKDYALGEFDTCGGVKGLKYHDLNANGAQDSGEPGLSGWTIFLDANGNGVLDSGETSKVTGSNGETAEFSDLQTGTYTFCEVLQSNWINSDPGSATTVAGKQCKSVTVATDTTTVVKFGNYQNATKSGVKFDDLNGNGAKDTGEPNLTGWVIKIYADSDGDGVLSSAELTAGAVFTDTTDATGYSFSITPGKYIVCEEAQTGWQQTYPSGNTKCSAGSTLAAAGYAIDLASQQTDTDNDFGNSRLYKLIVVTCNTVTETLVDSTVNLNATNSQTITAVPTALANKGVTQADLCGLGGASYDNLPAGTYTPSVELPDVAPLFP